MEYQMNGHLVFSKIYPVSEPQHTPMTILQLTNWLKFIEYMENKGDVTATTIVYERCLVPCASYPGENLSVHFSVWVCGMLQPGSQHERVKSASPVLLSASGYIVQVPTLWYPPCRRLGGDLCCCLLLSLSILA